MYHKSLRLLALAASLCLASLAHGAMEAYVYIKGAKSGVIKGSTTVRGYEDTIAALDFEQTSTAPVDATTGLSTGKVRIGHVIFTKVADRSTPLLRQMLTTSEIIPEASIRFAATNGGGVSTFYTAKITSGRIVSVKTEAVIDPNTKLLTLRDTVEISFERIDWTWAEGNVTTSESLNNRT